MHDREIGWPYQVKRYMSRVTFHVPGGREVTVKNITKSVCLEFASRIAVKEAREFLRHDPEAYRSPCDVDTMPFDRDPPSVYSRAGRRG